MKTKISKTIEKTLLIGIFSILFFSKLDAQNLSLDYVEGEVIVQLNSNVEPNQLTQSFSQIGLTQKQEISDILNIWLFQYDLQTITPDSCLMLIKSSNLVKTAQFNHYIFTNAVPNDPGFSNQWGMNKIKAPDAWNITTGGTTVQNDQIVIAIVDDGFDINHEDIDFWKNNAEIPGNNIDDDGNGYVDDYDGWNAYNNNGTITSANHGTHVSGIAGAKGNNGIGVTGVNWNVKIMPIQASSQTEATVVAGYLYILKMRQLYNQTNGTQGAFIVVTNASFCTNSTSNTSADDYPIWCGIYDALGNEGVLNVNAPNNIKYEIGGSSGTFGYAYYEIPAICSSEFLIVVANTDQNDDLYDKGPLSDEGSSWSKTYVDLAAPGTGIYSTLPGNSYGNQTGTSMAAPHVAGAIALMYAAACDQLITNYKTNPSAVALSMKQFILNWSDPIYSLLLKIGYGRLNVYRSIIKMYEQYDNDLYVTGAETTSKQYDAINNITVENYTAVGNYDVTFRSGNSITFKPGTDLKPEQDKTIHAFIDKATFDCAIPYQPLSVDLIAPEWVYCGGGDNPIFCNAIPTGGKTPYSYVWYTKVITSSSWVTHNVNSPNFVVGSSEDFYVQAQVTDDRGITALSPIKFVNCTEAKIAAISDSLYTPADTIINLANSGKQLTNSQTFIESNNLRQSFNAFPNPTTGKVTITFTLAKAGFVTIQISDNTGKKVADVVTNKPYEIGKNSIEYNGKDLPAGLYFYTISTNEGINALKLVLTK
ncbi:MAG: hypothetical protein A2X08_12500 [Bacteroidetes bacterium GWA2_32_17]|nr:MAG: hypothetical protein A2X08_12500 [Bacteroidetes bacterium GWA2_32_17]